MYIVNKRDGVNEKVVWTTRIMSQCAFSLRNHYHRQIVAGNCIATGTNTIIALLLMMRPACCFLSSPLCWEVVIFIYLCNCYRYNKEAPEELHPSVWIYTLHLRSVRKQFYRFQSITSSIRMHQHRHLQPTVSWSNSHPSIMSECDLHYIRPTNNWEISVLLVRCGWLLHFTI